MKPQPQPRRKFLSDSLGGAAALSGLTTLAIRANAASPNDKIVASIIGVGGMGSGHVKRLLTRSDVQLKTIAEACQITSTSPRPNEPSKRSIAPPGHVPIRRKIFGECSRISRSMWS